MMDLEASRKANAANSAQATRVQNELDRYPVTTPFGRRAITPVGPKITEELVVTSLGHAFGEIPPPVIGPPKRYFVQDFLVDQSQSTGGGAKMQNPIQFDLSAAYGYRYSITAPSGMRFQVKAPPGAQQLAFAAYLGRSWLNSTSGGFFDVSTAMTQFANISGPSPTLTYNEFFITNGNNQALAFEVEATCQDFSFTAFVSEQSFSPRTQDPGAKWYQPYQLREQCSGGPRRLHLGRSPQVWGSSQRG